MLEKTEKYDPKIYGKLKSELLKSLDLIPSTVRDDAIDTEKKIRRSIMKDIKKGKLIVKH
jgi:hypothetical protein